MDQGPLGRDQANPGAELIRRLSRSVPVKAAFWLKDSDEGHWLLHIASDRFDSPGRDAGYREVLRIAEEIADPYLDPVRVTLIPTSHKLAQAALEILQKHPWKTAIRLGGMPFGGTSIDGAHIYLASEITAAAQ
jgi:hypothetical protein